jgi:hypothetical protein
MRMFDPIDYLKKAYTSKEGINPADVEVYPLTVGIPQSFGQPTPGDQKRIGFSAKDITSKMKFLNPIFGVQGAAVTNQDFKGPEIYRTTSSIMVEPGTWGAFAGHKAAELLWNSEDMVKTDTMGYKSPLLNLGGLDAFRALFIFKDIGQRMIPDAAQTFDTFAGGLNRKIGGMPQKIVDWKSFGSKGKKPLIASSTSWVENTEPWLNNYTDVLSQGWNRGLMGQGWKAFQGFKSNIGPTVPASRSIFATVG